MQWENVKNIIGTYCASKVPVEGIIGLGSGTTAEAFVRALAKQFKKESLSITCVCSSVQTEELARHYALPITPLHLWNGEITCMFDGADAINTDGTAIKGAGGALIREKILAKAAKRVVLMVDERKWCIPWHRCTLPLAVIPFGKAYVQHELTKMGYTCNERMQKNTMYITDDSLIILDVNLETKHPSLPAVAKECRAVTGVVDTGFFSNLDPEIVIGHASGTITHLYQGKHI